MYFHQTEHVLKERFCVFGDRDNDSLCRSSSFPGKYKNDFENLFGIGPSPRKTTAIKDS